MNKRAVKVVLPKDVVIALRVEAAKREKTASAIVLEALKAAVPAVAKVA